MEHQLEKIICLLRQIADNKFDIIQIALSVVACVFAWFIPKRIMWEQSYSSLMSDYRSYDFGIAVQGIVEFFAVDCNYDVKNIKKEYERRFVRDVYDLDLDSDLNSTFSLETVRKELKTRNPPKICEKSPDLCLHYQRRLLAQFYYQLDLCARSPFIGKRRVCRDFTSREADTARLLYLMGMAVDESGVLFKDISCGERMPRSARGLNGYLADIYHLLRASKPYMVM
ncbi:MAG: hypothetical protein K2J81_07490 [Treponemataceae bacterium]|nr:hypothetical protein [Treponemataceae bacterium]